jgi:hypothetical protein
MIRSKYEFLAKGGENRFFLDGNTARERSKSEQKDSSSIYAEALSDAASAAKKGNETHRRFLTPAQRLSPAQSAQWIHGDSKRIKNAKRPEIIPANLLRDVSLRRLPLFTSKWQ